MSKLFFFFSYQNLYFCQLNVVGWRFLMNKETKALLSSCLTPKAPIPTGFYICIYRVLYLISSFFFSVHATGNRTSKTSIYRLL